MVVYSHPGKKLKTHLQNVSKLGERKGNNKKVFNNYFIPPNILVDISKIIFFTHDSGKCTKYFQEYLTLSNRENLSADFNKLKRHGLFSAVFTYIFTKAYLKKQNIEDDYFWLPFFSYLFVRWHHGNLKDLGDMFLLEQDDLDILEQQYNNCSWQLFAEICQELKLNQDILPCNTQEFLAYVQEISDRKKQRKLSRLLRDRKSINFYIFFCYCYSLLISSDKLEASCTESEIFQKVEKILEQKKEIPSHIVEEYKKEKYKEFTGEINSLRDEVYQQIMNKLENINLEEKIYSLNVPTGIGKTLTAFAFALKLRGRLSEKIPRKIIYVLPFTSIIDQNFSVLKDVLQCFFQQEIANDYLVKHHHLAEKNYNLNEDENLEFNQAELLIENWDSEIIVTTFVQFLHSLLTNKNRNLKKYANIANSIIILDEVQTVPYKYWLVINQTLKALAEQLNCYFVLLTATLPLIFSEEKKEIIELCENKEEIFANMNRIELDISHLNHPMTLEEFKDFALSELEKYLDNDFLFVLNTIKSSIELYEFLSQEVKEKELYYLSTNIVPQERLSRIMKIKEKSSKNKVIVSTQMIEAGVDIDIHRVYRDFAPLDSINQTAGRCNRNGQGSKKGTVTLVNLINENNQNTPFSNYVYKDAIQLDITKKILLAYEDIIPESEFFALSKKYFKLLNEKKSNDTSRNILASMQVLNFTKVAEQFQLIKNEYAAENIFVEINDKAKDQWQRYLALKKIQNPFQRKAEFNKFKKDFLENVVNLPKNILKLHPEIVEEHGIYYLPYNLVDNCYEQDTGFKRVIEVNTFF